jgi:hypothetical protein
MKHLRNKSDDALSVAKRYFGSVKQSALVAAHSLPAMAQFEETIPLGNRPSIDCGGPECLRAAKILFTDDSKKLLTSIGRSLIRVRWSSPCHPHRHLRRGLCGDRLYTAARRQHWPAGDRAPNGQYRVWLLRAIVDRLARMRGARESYIDVAVGSASISFESRWRNPAIRGRETAMAIGSNPLRSTRKSGVRKASDRVIRIEPSAPARPCGAELPCDETKAKLN